MPKRCVIYVRVSTAEQAAAGHHSLDAQELLCRRYAEAADFEVVETLRDEGYSGRTTNRPGYRRLSEYMSKTPPTPINAILIQDTSRMGRDTTEYLLLRRDLAQLGIALVAVTQPNIDASPEGRLMDTIVAGINQYQSEEKGRRVTIAMTKKFEEGWWPGWAPLGYLNIGDEGRRRVEPDPERFPLIQRAFTEFATGRYTQERLGVFLAELGLRDRNGRPLSRTSLNHLLANPFYWGLMRWKGKERIGLHQAAVDRATWERCQAITAEHNRHMSRARKHDFLLAGLTVCHACGNRHTHSVHVEKQKRYYHCKSAAHCPQPHVPADDLEAKVANLIQAFQLTDEFIERVIAKAEARFAEEHADHDQNRDALRRKQASLERQRDTLEQELLEGTLPGDAFDRHMPRINAELNSLYRDLGDLEDDRQLDTETLREVLRFVRDIPAAYAGAPDGLKKQYVRFFFDRIDVNEREIVSLTPTQLLSWLLEDKLVRTNANWLPRLELIRTDFVAFVRGRGVDKLAELVRKIGSNTALQLATI